MAHDTTLARNDALARATALAGRARALRRAQTEVQDLTAREVAVLARTAASFFDAIQLPEFTATLMPQSARGLRRIRHRVLHRTIHNSDTGTLIRALLLGRDGMLRLFSARSADSRDLLLILEPGRSLPTGVVREVVDWTPTQRVPGFRPFEILDRLSHSLDAVEDQIGEAEQRVQVQKAALESGDLSALLAAAPAQKPTSETRTSPRLLATPGAAIQQNDASATDRGDGLPQMASAVRDPFDVFERVEAVANAEQSASTTAVTSALPNIEVSVEPDEWNEPVVPPADRVRASDRTSAARSRSSSA